MVFQKKTYDEIVQEILEHVTKGAIRELYDYEPEQIRYRLGNAPVKQVVKVDGFLRGSRHVFGKGRDYRQIGDTLEWLPGGERPEPGTLFTVNYTFGEPTGITDANPGSVVRTIVEAVSRELDLFYEEMEQVYMSGFIDTATGKALEMVVSLLGVNRTPPQKATGTVTFGRITPPDLVDVTGEAHVFGGKFSYELKTQPVGLIKEAKGDFSGKPTTFEPDRDYVLNEGSIRWLQDGRYPDDNSSFIVAYSAYQKIVVPKETVVTTHSPDPQKVRSYATTEAIPLLPQPDGKWEADVTVEATVPGKQGNAPAGSIRIMPRPPSGVEYVVNRQEILTGVDAETDAQLRTRAKKALEAAGKATLASIESAIRRIEGVRSILIQDRPDNVPGIIKVVVDGGDEATIRKAIDDTRSAGTYVEYQTPKIATVDVNITAIARKGANPPQAQAGIEERVRSHLSRLEIGEDVVYSRIMATILEGSDVHDVEQLSLVVKKEGEAAEASEGENILVTSEERAQVRNVNVSVRERQ